MKNLKIYITPKCKPVVIASAATLLSGSLLEAGEPQENTDITGNSKGFGGFYDFDDEE